jgi:hypothetical protein
LRVVELINSCWRDIKNGVLVALNDFVDNGELNDSLSATFLLKIGVRQIIAGD